MKYAAKNDLVESFSGIRGIYGKSINEEFARQYAWSYCQLFGDRNLPLIIGSDSRSSGHFLKRSMIKTFQDWGVKKIIDVGVVPIQVCEYAVLKFKAQGGVYISASHNEPDYNGWKFLKKDGALLYPGQVERLVNLVHQKQKNKPDLSLRRSDFKIIKKQRETVDGYISFVFKKIGPKSQKKIKKSKFKILFDPNGGSAVVVLEKLFKKLGVKTEIVNGKLGKFHRLIEPNVESLRPLVEKVSQQEFAFGCGFDCDADRVELVIPSGYKFAKEIGLIVSGQYVLALACESILAGTKGQTVVTNDVTSYLIRDVIKKYGARLKEVEVGEMNVIQEMEKQKSIIGGEGSNGGVIIPPIKCRDGIMTVVLILKMLADWNKRLDDVLMNYPRYYSRRTKVACPVSLASAVKKKIERYFKKRGFKIKKTGGITGGLKIMFDENSYIWFRSSKTEAGVFRIIADGDDYEKVKNLLKEGIKIFNKFKK